MLPFQAAAQKARAAQPSRQEGCARTRVRSYMFFLGVFVRCPRCKMLLLLLLKTRFRERRLTLFGSLIEYGTLFLGCPKGDPNFDEPMLGAVYHNCRAWRHGPAWPSPLRFSPLPPCPSTTPAGSNGYRQCRRPHREARSRKPTAPGARILQGPPQCSPRARRWKACRV